MLRGPTVNEGSRGVRSHALPQTEGKRLRSLVWAALLGFLTGVLGGLGTWMPKAQGEWLGQHWDVPGRSIPRMPSARLAIIIDDFGSQRAVAETFLAIRAQLTYSVLPQRPWSRWFARQALARGYSLMLHLPMEPWDYPAEDPGRLAILASMTEEQIRRTVREAVASVPGAIGVDNHMGSRITEDRGRMRVILEELVWRNLFYVDSLTTPRSVAYAVGRQLGMPVLKNRLFLDNDLDPDRIQDRLQELSDIALRNGQAIGIGHPYWATVRALRRTLPELEARGIQVVPISHLLRPGDRP